MNGTATECWCGICYYAGEDRGAQPCGGTDAMTESELVDRLAEFCGLKEKDYVRHDDGWIPYYEAHNNPPAWNPLVSDDDCRVVLEVFYRTSGRHQRILFADALVDFTKCSGIPEYLETGLIASPAAKCQAVARIMGW